MCEVCIEPETMGERQTLTGWSSASCASEWGGLDVHSQAGGLGYARADSPQEAKSLAERNHIDRNMAGNLALRDIEGPSGRCTRSSQHQKALAAQLL